VKNLSWALVTQEKQLVEWITARQDDAAMMSATALFKVWDYDGDGFIDREEWAEQTKCSNALDRNRDGRITLQEMAIGLGAPYKPRSSSPSPAAHETLRAPTSASGLGGNVK